MISIKIGNDRRVHIQTDPLNNGPTNSLKSQSLSNAYLHHYCKPYLSWLLKGVTIILPDKYPLSKQESDKLRYIRSTKKIRDYVKSFTPADNTPTVILNPSQNKLGIAEVDLDTYNALIAQEKVNQVLTKLKPLLVLAGNNSNKAEADLAMKKALELMARYNVTSVEQVPEQIIELSYPLKGQFLFKGCLIGVFIYKNKEHKQSELRLVGHESKLRSCVAMIDYALQNAKYLMPKGLSHVEKQGYYVGYSFSFKELLIANEQESEPGLEVSLQQYKDFAGGNFILSPKSRSVTITSDATRAGLNAGGKANLNPQFGTRALPGK